MNLWFLIGVFNSPWSSFQGELFLFSFGQNFFVVPNMGMSGNFFLWSLPILFLGMVFWLVWHKGTKLDPKAFDQAWRDILLEKVGFYVALSPAERLRFEQEILYFFDQVTITGVEVDIDDTDRILVASSAVIPLFGFPELRFRNISEVLLYKDSFNAENQTVGEYRNILGKVGSGTMNRLMILSLPALHAGFEKEGTSNVGIHEFVHLIDKADGATDGIPESLMQKQYVLPWIKMMHRECTSIKKGISDINPYGASSDIEFLSVVSEYFFSNPDRFRKVHPQLYELLATLYRQEPKLGRKPIRSGPDPK
ncbi:zinc-dependent peptidase [Flagellimonas beolgyonensis]|uniref:M90 family metallopeptidase n=1 Tax=Flagellimonas beolgyonensis TaxID=864064 RepID=UPI003D65A19B